MNNKKVFVIMVIIMLFGTAVRLYGLTERTMTHIETYVPGIDFPAGLSDPEPRLTLKQTLIGILVAEEPHPPGHYLLMLAWTKLFGSGILALRLPSVIFAVLSIPLLYVLGADEYGRTVGLLAAGLLALNGYHVFWSQLSKMYVLACLLGIASTLLLIFAIKASTRSKRLFFHLLYSGVTLFGLVTTHYFWFLLASQVVWVLIRGRSLKAAPDILRVQLATIIVGSPLISLAIFQSRRPSYLNTNIIKFLSQYFQFGNLFEPDWNSPSPGLFFMLSGVILTILGLLVIGIGLRAEDKKDDWGAESTVFAPWSVIVVLAVPVAFLSILRFARFTQGFHSNYSRLVVLSSLLPLVLLIGYFLVVRYYRFVRKFLNFMVDKWTWSIPSEISPYLALMPVAILVLMSPFVNMMASRGVLLYVPFLLVVIARGLVVLANRSRIWIALVAVLLLVNPLSINYYRNSLHEHPTDYKRLAEIWTPKIEDADLIFVQRHWVTTPIFYYLDSDEYNIIGWDYEDALRRYPDSRVWVLSFEGLSNPKEMSQALAGSDPLMFLESLGLYVSLFDPQ